MLTGVQLAPVYFSSQFLGVDITFWVRLVNIYGWKQVCFRNYILDNTLDNGTPDVDNDFDDNKDDDDNNHNSDDNNDDK